MARCIAHARNLCKSFLATVFLKTVEAGWAGRGPIAPFLSISY